MNNFIYVKGFIGIKTKLNSFKWPFGFVKGTSSDSDFDNCLIKIYITVANDRSLVNHIEYDSKLKKFNYFFFDDKKRLYYDRVLFGIKLSYCLFVHNNEIHVTLGKNYLKFIKYRFMNLHPFNLILFDLVCGLLLLNGYSSLYCSSVYFSETKKCALFFSAPNTGKTTLCLKLLKGNNSFFVSEDIAITDGDKVWSVPWTSSYRTYKKSNLDKRINNREYIEYLIKTGKVVSNVSISHLYVLEVGEETILEDDTIIDKKIKLLNNYLMRFRDSPVLQVLNYFNQFYDIDEMEKKQNIIFEKLISNKKRIHISSQSQESFFNIILKEMEV